MKELVNEKQDLVCKLVKLEVIKKYIKKRKNPKKSVILQMTMIERKGQKESELNRQAFRMS